MNIRLLIVWLALGLLAAGGCVGPKVLTDFDPSAEFSAFRTFAFAGLTDGIRAGCWTIRSCGSGSKRWSAGNSPPRDSGKSAWKTVPTCWCIFGSV